MLVNGAMSNETKRFSVTLDADDYERLKKLCDSCRPPMSLRYVVGFAVRQFLDQAKDPKITRALTDPTASAQSS